jgi:hypothetical protein
MAIIDFYDRGWGINPDGIASIYSDEQGETHTGVLEIAEQEARLGPPPNPMGLLSDSQAVSSLAFINRAPA